MFDSLFKEKRRREKVVRQADEKIAVLVRRRDDLDSARQMKLQRQVDLWSIPHLDSATEEEYFVVSRLIADLIKEIAAIDEYISDLRQARYECVEAKKTEEIDRLLAIEDPWAEKIKLGTQDEVPRLAVLQ